ncbi:hypothetical protein C3H76_09210 [Campylobacter jejuni]|uniref:hypothetical protein n=1 Tax=Campylobacter jejuni TaxID=197 RepID=UPI000F8141EC|nr:hypothetical protein [Campylobacter jejuni]RTJ39277.1 hypothetical protein C3H76_09210 [Campylobacter jejuni]
MSETYKIYTPNGIAVKVDKETNKIYFVESLDPHPPAKGNYTEEYSKALFKAHNIKRNSPYKDYKPQYLDPEFHTGEKSTLLEFKDWQSIYLKDPIKGAIAPWTKAEKAYYKSLKTKRERYKYLAIRSGLRSVVIDIPYDAYANVDEKGNLINEEYAYIYDEVSNNKETLKSSLFRQEWGIAAGILGKPEYFVRSKNHGFNARMIQCFILYIQLTGGGYEELGIKRGIYNYADNLLEIGMAGIHKNPLRAKLVKDLAKTIQPDEFGMLPFIDEIMGVDWVIDLNRYRFALDEEGRIIWALYDDIEKGKLKDPRDIDSTPESRNEFDHYMDGYANGMETRFDADIPNDWGDRQATLFKDTLVLSAKLAALTPPQGYPNAPRYYSPERLEIIYKRHKLDKLLDPRIPAIYRYNFPEDLRAKIRAYAKEHNIKE